MTGGTRHPDVLIVGGKRIPVVEPEGARTGPEVPTVAERAPFDPPTAVTGQYLPALDGLRALAVGGVLAYHLGFGWASGGYLGVDLFFVLSGFLITSLLLEEWVTTQGIRLVAFWARRARRLLPALFMVLVAVVVFVALYGRLGPAGSASQFDLAGLRGDALATLFYVANWHSIFAHQSYFAQFASPSPFEHTWSLAIEEQFYLVWPPVLLGLVTLAKRRWRQVGMVVAVAGACGSAALMAALYNSGTSLTRVYFGTDTHLFSMLAGATVAMVAASRPQPGPRGAGRVARGGAPLRGRARGLLGRGRGAEPARPRRPRDWMFRGGFVVCAALAAVVIADVRQFHLGPLGALLAVRPLRWIGTISYGIYLWHWPIFVFCDPARTGLSGAPLDLLRVGLTVGVAAVSYYAVERPIRQRRPGGWVRFALAPAAIVATGALVVVGTLPAVAAPGGVAPSTATVAVGGRSAVPGSGGISGETPLAVAPVSPADPLRVTVFGDSVPNVAAPALAAALGATGEVTVTDGSADGFGLNRALPDYTWRTGIPALMRADRTQVVLATWSWDDRCTPRTTVTRNFSTYTCALEHPAAYRAELEQAVRLMLGPGGAEAVVFMQFPLTGPDAADGESATDPTVAAKDAGERGLERDRRVVARRVPRKGPLPAGRVFGPLRRALQHVAPARRAERRPDCRLGARPDDRRGPLLSRRCRALRRRRARRPHRGPPPPRRRTGLVDAVVDVRRALRHPAGELPRRPPAALTSGRLAHDVVGADRDGDADLVGSVSRVDVDAHVLVGQLVDDGVRPLLGHRVDGPAHDHDVVGVVGVDHDDGDAGVAGHVALLRPAPRRVDDEVVPLHGDPQRRALRAAVRGQRRQRGDDRSGEQGPRPFGESVGHRSSSVTPGSDDTGRR